MEHLLINCAAPEIIHTPLPPRKGLEFPGSGGSVRHKKFSKEICHLIGISRGVV